MPRLTAILWLLFLIGSVEAAAPLSIHASVPPIATLAKEIGGIHVHAFSLLRPGDNPETFSPTPRQLTQLSDSHLFIRIGLPFEKIWMPRIRGIHPGLPILDLRSRLQLPPPAQGHHHGNGESDPHLWTDPIILKRISGIIRDALIRIDPEHAADYRLQQQQVAGRLEQLQHRLERALAPVRGRSFLVFHPAWGYFAQRYGLHQLAIEHEGKQSGAHWMTELIRQARTEGIHVIVVQPQFDQRLAREIAKAIDGRIAMVDPLSRNYRASLERLARLIMGERP